MEGEKERLVVTPGSPQSVLDAIDFIPSQSYPRSGVNTQTKTLEPPLALYGAPAFIISLLSSQYEAITRQVH